MMIMELIKRHALRMALSLVITLPFLLNTLGVVHLGFIQRLENYTYDLRLQWTMPNTIDKRIVILDVFVIAAAMRAEHHVVQFAKRILRWRSVGL